MNLNITISFAMVLLALVSFGNSSPIGETTPESETIETGKLPCENILTD